MDYNRLARFGREDQLSLEGPVLQRTGRMIVMEIETRFPHGYDPGVPEGVSEPALRVIVPAGGVVGVQARGRHHPRLQGGQGQGAFRAVPGLADDHDPPDAGGPGTVENVGQIMAVGRIRQMAMGID